MESLMKKKINILNIWSDEDLLEIYYEILKQGNNTLFKYNKTILKKISDINKLNIECVILYDDIHAFKLIIHNFDLQHIIDTIENK